MITIKNAWVTFNRGTPLENSVLKGLDLTIDEGEFLTIIGANGAGKSTLMNILSGDIFPSQGSIQIDGLDVTKLPAHERAYLVARVFQDPMAGTCPHLNIEENLALALCRGKKRNLTLAITPSLRSQFQNLLATLGIGLENRLKDPMGMLSGGQRQAISLLMSTLQPSKILLLDEHTAALDPRMGKKVMALTVKLIKKHRLTALMITHSMTHALEYGNKTILMKEGKVAKVFEKEQKDSLKPTDLLALFEI